MSAMISVLRRGAVVLLACLPLWATVATDAQQVVQQTVDELLNDLKTNKQQYLGDREAFYRSLNDILGPVVDARRISRSIMPLKYPRSAAPEQLHRFDHNLQVRMMQ